MRLVALANFLGLVVSVGCSSSGATAWGGVGSGGSGGDGAGSGIGGANGLGGATGLGGALFPDGGGPAPRDLDGAVVNYDAACATSSAAAEKLPVDLVFMVDHSDSMNKPNKYPACAIGMKAFFQDLNSKGIQASIQFFCGGGSATKCEGYLTSWAVPAVPVTPLPEPMKFAQAIDSQTFCNGTPTDPALTAAIDYAKTLRTPGRRVAVVLVTDGLPTTCGSLKSVVAVAQANAATVPTYVIGVGKALDNLNDIALAGGTQKAIMVTSDDPAKVAQDFEAALDVVRAGNLSCDFGIPPPPAGETLARDKVNVTVTAGGQSTALAYDGACAAGTGWRYDDLNAPTKILLCPSACNAAKSDPSTKVEVLFGCETVGQIR
jgi:von Willebrand factor type A domain